MNNDKSSNKEATGHVSMNHWEANCVLYASRGCSSVRVINRNGKSAVCSYYWCSCYYFYSILPIPLTISLSLSANAPLPFLHLHIISKLTWRRKRLRVYINSLHLSGGHAFLLYYFQLIFLYIFSFLRSELINYNQ